MNVLFGLGALALAILLDASGALAQNLAASAPRLTYPPTERADQFDNYHGTRVADPYRWLEDSNSPKTRAWVEAQNKVTFAYLQGIRDREPIKKRLTKIWNYEKYGIPNREGGRFFFTRNSGLQNQSVLYTAAKLGETPRVLLDPNALSKDGTVALTGIDITDDGRYLAYGTAASGSDWQQWRVREVATGRDLPDVIRWVKFSEASWSKDGTGFFYSRYDEPNAATQFQDVNYFQKLYFHRLGTPQDQDVLVYE
ncbi:MAG: S9 family peptidase, partial [Aphanocapsa lilacina HA4352-LM1]|nr:S9 family peptidase [Aphanocapsa lilacina HA4352-LM1]